MATQPRFPPDPGKRPQLVPPSPRKHPRHLAKVRIYAIAAISFVLVLSFLVYLIRRGPQQHVSAASATLLPQPNNGELQVSSIQMIRAGSSDALTLTGQITNTGSRNLNGAQAQVAFHDEKGSLIARVVRPIAGLADGNCEVANEFARRPIKPGDLRFFCVSVNQVPADWNHEPPDTQVVTVTSPN